MKNISTTLSRWLAKRRYGTLIFVLILILTNCGHPASEKDTNEIKDSVAHQVDSVVASNDQKSHETEQAVKEAEKRVNEKEKRETN